MMRIAPSLAAIDWVGKTIRQAFPSIEGQGFFEVLDRVYQTGDTYEATSTPVHYQRSPELLPRHDI